MRAQREQSLERGIVRSPQTALLRRSEALAARGLCDLDRSRREIRRGATIIVVDDDRQTLDLYEDVLRSTIGANVLATTDPLAALQAALYRSPQLFVTDLFGPDEPNGFDRIRYLRDHAATSGIPILVISGVMGSEVMCHTLKVGAEMVMKKPFDCDTMIEYAKLLISRNMTGKHPAGIVDCGLDRAEIAWHVDDGVFAGGRRSKPGATGRPTQTPTARRSGPAR